MMVMKDQSALREYIFKVRYSLVVDNIICHLIVCDDILADCKVSTILP